MVGEIEILAGGVQASVQDLGRSGYRAVGVPGAGAMDRFALVAANLIVGNPRDRAGIEVLLGGLSLRCLTPTVLCVTGADLQATIDHTPLARWTPTVAPAGAQVTFGTRARGARAYLAFAGGIGTPAVLGSRSTYLPGGWGGYEGRALRPGDRLPLGVPLTDARTVRALPPEHLPPYSSFPTLRCVPGPHQTLFDPATIETFFSAVYRLSPACDRMGYRLDGPTLKAAGEQSIASLGVLPGCVQVPPHGQPIMLMADAQTTGGYPLIATVIGPDLPLAAQLLPGDRVRFQPIAVEQAIRAAQEEQERLRHWQTTDIVGVPV